MRDLRGYRETQALRRAVLERLNTVKNKAKGPLFPEPLHCYRKRWESEDREGAEAVDRVYHASTDADRLAALRHLRTEIADACAERALALAEVERQIGELS